MSTNLSHFFFFFSVARWCVCERRFLSSLTYIDTFSDNANWIFICLELSFFSFTHYTLRFIHQILLTVTLFNDIRLLLLLLVFFFRPLDRCLLTRLFILLEIKRAIYYTSSIRFVSYIQTMWKTYFILDATRVYTSAMLDKRYSTDLLAHEKRKHMSGSCMFPYGWYESEREQTHMNETDPQHNNAVANERQSKKRA